MKKLNVIKSIVLSGVAVMFTLTSCEGPAGKDANSHCLDCHSEENWEGIVAGYETHPHYTGSSWEYAGNRGYCGPCHSTQEFTAFVDGVSSDVSAASPIDCNGCHGDHGSLEDPVEVVLATTDPVIAMVDGETALDFGEKSNLCINCHQPRRGYEYYEAVDSVEIEGVMTAVGDGEVGINSSHAGPHYGTQSYFLLGKGNYLSVSGPHSDLGCVDCHMGDDGAAGHTWVPQDENCTTCHTDGVPEGIDYDFDADMAIIAEALVAAGALAVDDEGGYESNENIVSADVFEAFWAYMYLYTDHSHGVHNPSLAEALIDDAKNKLADYIN